MYRKKRLIFTIHLLFFKGICFYLSENNSLLIYDSNQFID